MLGTQDWVSKTCACHSACPERSRTYYTLDQLSCRTFISRHLGSSVKWLRLCNSPWCLLYQKRCSRCLELNKWAWFGIRVECSGKSMEWGVRRLGLPALGLRKSSPFLEPWLPYSFVRSESEELSRGSSSSNSLWFWGLGPTCPLILFPYASPKGMDTIPCDLLWMILRHDMVSWLWHGFTPQNDLSVIWAFTKRKRSFQLCEVTEENKYKLTRKSPSSSLSQRRLCQRIKPSCLKKSAVS